ncbi:glycerophosphodiester phosphodiesterase [Corynebacterium yudongzhengii]|uniref:Glycerophosphodiester phosphodiesterase n=1 Tax=Corynebacterium yudongzhengii TaxID=2080740 RepID=A0A2U1T8C2_9CORY|nr:glycerophosphodiester phosphodiesterase family protein [Corynebacterium yudongzhengii]AWB82802.1 glycerophosphodiester phosphodiesterase [Corynebacterium yudongzhengii]PWC02138.1 glycerophosphodiester phosphodiesterase [Corynebacterium yudongzhengii]
MKIVAHRGLAPGYQELTRAAYEYTLGLPIHGVECDVRLCRSGELVLHHDRRIGRTNVGGEHFTKISELTLDELRRENFGTPANPQTILTLPELLEMIVDAGDKHLYLEIKHPSRYGRMQEERIRQDLIYAGLLHDERIHVISFSHTSMRRMAELIPDIDRIYLRRHWELRYNPKDLMLSSPTGLGLSVGTAKLRPDLVGAQELPTYLWTTNSSADMKFGQKVGADIVATDYPEKALATYGQLASVD